MNEELEELLKYATDNGKEVFLTTAEENGGWQNCPKCHHQTLHPLKVFNCLSVDDNKTYVCMVCGRIEDIVNRELQTLTGRPE